MPLFQFRDGNIKCRRVHYSFPLELYPEPIHSRPWEDHVELHLRASVRYEWVIMDHVDQIIAGREHVRLRLLRSRCKFSERQTGNLKTQRFPHLQRCDGTVDCRVRAASRREQQDIQCAYYERQ